VRRAHEMTTEISGEELRERMRAVLKDCVARHSKSEILLKKRGVTDRWVQHQFYLVKSTM